MSHALRSQSIYAYIVQCREQDDLPPTMREISAACDIPLTAILRHLNWLEARGYVIRDHTTRSIRPLKPPPTDEELVYTCLVRSIKVNGLAPSLNILSKVCRLLPSRVRAALQTLEQAGRVRPDPEDPRFFYPTEADRKS